MNIVFKRLSAAMIAAAAAVSPAFADYADFSGKWAVNGHIIGGGAYLLVMPVCTLQQNGGEISGFCRGPNGEGPAAGSANGFQIKFQWQVHPTNPMGVAGVASFIGALGGDGVVRGRWTSSAWRGAVGDFTATRV